MHMLGILACLARPHRPDNRRVLKTADGRYFGYCASCGAKIRRIRRGQWTRAWRWPAQDDQASS